MINNWEKMMQNFETINLDITNELKFRNSIFIYSILFFTILPFVSAIAQNIRIENANNYIQTEQTNEYVLIKWNAFEEIPREAFGIDSKIDLKNKNIGYLVYVFEKEDSATNLITTNSKGNSTTNWYAQSIDIRLYPGYKQKIYYTKNRCLFLPDLKPSKSYLITIRYIFKIDETNSSSIYFLRAAGVYALNLTINPYTIKTPNNYQAKKNATECINEVLPKLTIKELMNNIDSYDNKFIEVEGYFIEPKIGFKKDKLRRSIINFHSEGQNTLTDGNYLLSVEGLTNDLKSSLEFSYPGENYIECLVLIHKINTSDKKNKHYNYDQYKKIIAQSARPKDIPLFLQPQLNFYECDLIHVLDIRTK
jgi:hypothetical protein